MSDDFDKVKQEERKRAEYAAIPVISWAELEAKVNKWMLLSDKGVHKLLLATIVANRLETDPVWLFLLAVSGGGKTELMNMLLKVPEFYVLSQLTPNTFLSGYKSKDKVPSLLHQLGSNKTIGFKDFTSLLDGNGDAFKEIMGQLRDIFDGYLVKRLGTGDEIEWKGKLGFIAGCTDIIEQRMAVIGAMGERFMSYRIKQPKRKDVKARLRQNTGKEKLMREELQIATAGYLKGVKIPEEMPKLPEEVENMIDALTDFIAISRAVVMRGRDTKKEIEYIVQPEMSTRSYKQLYALAMGLMIINEGTWTELDSEILRKLAISSVHTIRYNLLFKIQQYSTEVKTATLAMELGYPTSTTRRYLEDLSAISMDEGSIKILKRTHRGPGKPDSWQLTPEMKNILKMMGSEIAPHKVDSDFDSEEKEIPINAEEGSNGNVEEVNEKIDDLTKGMTEEERQQYGMEL